MRGIASDDAIAKDLTGTPGVPTRENLVSGVRAMSLERTTRDMISGNAPHRNQSSQDVARPEIKNGGLEKCLPGVPRPALKSSVFTD
jgi:hypothetical protein